MNGRTTVMSVAILSLEAKGNGGTVKDAHDRFVLALYSLGISKVSNSSKTRRKKVLYHICAMSGFAQVEETTHVPRPQHLQNFFGHILNEKGSHAYILIPL
jgi:hypothetical protein